MKRPTYVLRQRGRRLGRWFVTVESLWRYLEAEA